MSFNESPSTSRWVERASNCEVLSRKLCSLLADVEKLLLIRTSAGGAESGSGDRSAESFDTLAETVSSSTAREELLPIHARLVTPTLWSILAMEGVSRCVEAQLTSLVAAVQYEGGDGFGVNAGVVAECVSVKLDLLESSLARMERNIEMLSDEVTAITASRQRARKGK